MNWRELAIRLGERMRHHAHCPTHWRDAADPENCPFCDDRAAYDAYVKKIKQGRLSG